MSYNSFYKEAKKNITRKDIAKAFLVIENFKDKEISKQLIENYLDLDTNKTKVEKFYIHCSDANNMTDNLDLHLEKILTNDIDKYIDYFHFPYTYQSGNYALLVTNDKDILNKYKFAINYDEFVMLCGFDSYDTKEISIKKDYIGYLDTDTFEYFIKILSNEIISATMNILAYEMYTDEEGNTYDMPGDNTYFDGWMENKEFKYFNPPLRYKNECDYRGIFQLEDIKKADTETLKKLLHVNILEITNNKNKYNWGWSNGYLKYYDQISCKRLYIKAEVLEKYKLDNTINFKVETKLDRNHYIEYYIKDIIQSSIDDDDDDCNISNNRNNTDIDRDYFEVMTDGQLGDYDNFMDNGGNIDDIDIWAGN